VDGVQGSIFDIKISTSTNMTINATYTRQPNPTVTALGLGGEFLEVVVYEFSTRGLYDAAAVGGGVVGSAFAEGDALGHWWFWGDKDRLASAFLLGVVLIPE
jgi:hypothetical protein